MVMLSDTFFRRHLHLQKLLADLEATKTMMKGFPARQTKG